MSVEVIGTMKLDELFASGNTPVHTKTVELAVGSGKLKRGQLIGETGGVFEPIESGATPYGILCADVDATAGATAMVYVSGHFNANAVIGYVEETHYDDLRKNGIFVEAALAY